VAYS